MTDLDIVRADVVPAPRDRWDAYVEAWASSQRSPQTERAYRIDERQWRDWCAGRGVHPVNAVRAHVDMWAGHLRDRGGYGGRPAAAKTVARKLAALASLYGYLVDEGVLLHSPTAHVKRPRVSKDYAATISLDEGQLQRVVDAAFEEGRTAHALVAVLAYTGARVSEALGCQVTDLVDDHGYRCLNVTRKGGESDRVALPPAAAHAVTAYVGARTDGPLFVSSGRPLTYPAVLALMARLTRRAGLPPGMSLHPHVFRASFATISFDHGVPLDRLQDAMGHADPRTTRGYDRGASSSGVQTNGVPCWWRTLHVLGGAAVLRAGEACESQAPAPDLLRPGDAPPFGLQFDLLQEIDGERDLDFGADRWPAPATRGAGDRLRRHCAVVS